MPVTKKNMRLVIWREFISIVYVIVIFIGLIGNILSLRVYSSSSMRKSTVAFLLCSLTIADIIVLISAIPLYGLFNLPVWDQPYLYNPRLQTLIAFSTKYIYPICMMAKTASLYIMVLITIERWIAVCKPLQVHIWCTFRNSVKAVFTIIVFSITFNCSKFMEYDVSFNKKFGYLLAKGPLYPQSNWWYFMIYFVILSVIFDFLLPFVVMFIMNMKVIKELRRSRKERLLITTTQQKEQNTTVMLLVVTILFGFCHFFAMSLKIFECFIGKVLTSQGNVFEVMGDVFNLLIVVHIATTFFIYFAFSARFRNVLITIYRPQLPVSSFTDLHLHRISKSEPYLTKYHRPC